MSLTTINRSRKRKKAKKKKPRRSGKQTSRISSRDLGDGIKGKERKRVCASCMNPPFIDRSLPRDFTWRITLSCAPPLRIFPRCHFFFPLSPFLFRKQSVIRSVTRVAAHLLIGFDLSIIPFMARTWLAHYRNVITNNKKRHGGKKDERKAFYRTREGRLRKTAIRGRIHTHTRAMRTLAHNS